MADLSAQTGVGGTPGRKETFDLISADKVEGTSVYNMAGDKVGSIHRVMIDKLSGKVVYATMAFGGVLGMGQKYHALPWNVLTYNTDLGGYQLDFDREKLEQGPSATEEELHQLFRIATGVARSTTTTALPGPDGRSSRVGGAHGAPHARKVASALSSGGAFPRMS